MMARNRWERHTQNWNAVDETLQWPLLGSNVVPLTLKPSMHIVHVLGLGIDAIKHA
jgi:hypothetical protein